MHVSQAPQWRSCWNSIYSFIFFSQARYHEHDPTWRQHHPGCHENHTMCFQSQRMCCEYQYQYQSHTKAYSQWHRRPKWSPKKLGRPGHEPCLFNDDSQLRLQSLVFCRQSEKAPTEDLCLPNKALLHCYIAFSMCRSVYHIQHIVDIYRYSTIAWGRFVVIKQQRMAEHADESKINIALHIITL